MGISSTSQFKSSLKPWLFHEGLHAKDAAAWCQSG
jgi:hypothetical protein